MKTIMLVSGIVLSLNLNPASASTEPDQAAAAADSAAATAAESAPTQKVSRYDFGDGMRIPVDGSSLEKFDKSLEAIKAKTTVDEYTSLTGAIDYLLIYDLGARRDRARLALRLDGQTGEQIVGMVNWGKRSKKARNKRAEQPEQDSQ